MRQELTLDQWKAEYEKDIRAFELYWRHYVQSNPDDFPAELTAGEWDEQFEFFREEV